MSITEPAQTITMNEDLYRVYLGAFAAGLNGNDFRIAESSPTARMWARAAGLADGIQSREPAKMPNDTVVGQMPEDFSRFCKHLGEAMTGISNGD